MNALLVAILQKNLVGKKTAQSLGRVRLPAAVLPYLPKSIKGRCLIGQKKQTRPTRR